MIFKAEHMESQYRERPKRLKEIIEFFDAICESRGKEAVITRVTDPVDGESGVHPAGRAVDCRNETRYKTECAFLFSLAEAKEIEELINRKFPRKDGKKTCIHHSFDGGPYHFHFQIPIGWCD